MKRRNIIVIGASAGGFGALQQLVAGLPSNLDVSIFIVWHMAPDVRGILPQVLNKFHKLHADHAVDGEPILPGRMYIAPPDRHLLLEKGVVRVTRGPKENRFRPAVDPLFRSAAYEYGSQVIGIILSGALDDGTAGLWTVKSRGGIAIVQDPEDAEVASMPENAAGAVDIDYAVKAADMGVLLERLCNEPINESNETAMNDIQKMEVEIAIALQGNALERGVMNLGALSPYTCPECHGVLTALQEGNRVRFRCHTGHAFSADSLLATITEKIEDSLWSAIRGVEESIILMNHMGDHFAESNDPKLAATYFKKAKEAENRIQLVRQAILTHEQLSIDSIRQDADGERNEELSQVAEDRFK